MESKREHPRRGFGFGRTAILEVDGRSHIVGLVDLSRGGAFLSTRVSVARESSLALRLLLPGPHEITLPCKLVRISNGSDIAAGRPPGLAVRFGALEAETERGLEEFVEAGLLATAALDDPR